MSTGNGVLGFLSGSVVPGAPTGTDSSTSTPLWYQDFLYNTANAATNLAQQPYTPFPGQQVATPSAATTQSWQMAENQANAGMPQLQQAQTQLQNATAPLTQSTINSYLNPEQSYLTGALDTNLSQNILPQIQSQFVSAGQAASPQQAQIENQAAYNTQQAVGQSLANNYQGALNTATQQQQLGLQGAGALGQLGALNEQLGAANTGLVAASGQAQDTLSQANINAAMNNFYQQQQYPYQQLGFMSNALNGLQLPTTSQSSGISTTPVTNSPSPLSAFAGTVAGVNSTPGLSSLFAADGGLVQKKKGMPGQLVRPGALQPQAWAL